MKLLPLALALAWTSTAAAQDFQVGARSKGMGGSYTAFEDDPTSIWLNPAGIATQADQASIQYQSYTQYEPGDATVGFSADPGKGDVGYIDPPLLPSYLGFVFQLGSDESPQAIGIAYARPFHMKFTYDNASPATDVEALEEQQFSRFRVSYARCFRLKAIGEPGFFPQIAGGIGLDLGYTKWEETDPPAAGSVSKDTSSSFGFGLGFLTTVYDDTDSFKVNFGVALQSKVDFNFQVAETLFPVWDWPQMINAGITFYLLPRQPLRVTIDMQRIAWSDAIADPANAGLESFRDSTNTSIGAEYKWMVDESKHISLLPRMGLRKLQAPWSDADKLPSTGFSNLLIDTKGSDFTVITMGLGVRWQTADGRQRGIDLGADFGADSYNVAFGYVFEF